MNKWMITNVLDEAVLERIAKTYGWHLVAVTPEEGLSALSGAKGEVVLRLDTEQKREVVYRALDRGLDWLRQLRDSWDLDSPFRSEAEQNVAICREFVDELDAQLNAREQG